MISEIVAEMILTVIQVSEAQVEDYIREGFIAHRTGTLGMKRRPEDRISF